MSVRYLLTSSPCMPDSPRLNPQNGFVDLLKELLPSPCRALFVCSSPDSPELTDRFGGDIREGFELTGFRFSRYLMLDRRNDADAAALIAESDLIILAGGHVPTQNAYFNEIGLSGLLRGERSVIMGISAGSMNAAETVYAQPEYDGEAVSPDYRRFLPGLGLTKTMILPHYQHNRDDVVDGMRIYEEIAFADSVGRRFHVLPDGSYVYGHDGIEELRGEARLIENGEMRLISEDGQRQILA